ncbi:tRNA pseudouridine(55) synthase TruB [Candidatus Cyanaurora vandensis]|uniref:tRNA pseudouridine(55) synthase TruB n=1 Tax=Candidatus Cyanaurora vandensis TaxID=2714958 RepID=UPI0025799168|nr:tRNA pseudouridine(55) synthase TruB [Candidatus Cyanaurora vandensis]
MGIQQPGSKVWQGFLNLHKEAGLTSHDCVGQVRRILKERRIGHGGTLDPLATGVLPLAVGPMTRLLPYLPDDKGYQATVRFGVQTTTDDLEGEILAQAPCGYLTLAEVQAALKQFVGQIEQVPPQYSAIRQQGKHLYELARAGIAVAVPPRVVQIHSLTVLSWRSGDFPEVVLQVSCGGGTYVRSLARDLGLALETGGTLAGLVRTQSSGFYLKESLTLDQVRSAVGAGSLQLLSPAQALNHFQRADLDEDAAQALGFGQKVPWFGGTGLVQVWQGEKFLGIGRGEGQKLQPITILSGTH